MEENCRNCGSELFVGQRFCRACGAPTESLSDEQAPTQMMPPQPEWGARSPGSTAPASRPETSPVYAPPSGYQPSVPPVYPAVVPPYAPPRKRSPLGWILAFLGMGLFVLVVIAVMMMARFSNRGRGSDSGGPPTQQRQNETLLADNVADTVDNVGTDTILRKTFPLGDSAKFALRNDNGNITITSWAQPKAEVSVIRRGSADRSAQVFFSNNGGTLSIRAAGGRGNQDVRFEVKLPRELTRVELSSTNGVIKISDVKAEILVSGTNGAIELANVVGASKIRTTNGSIKASLLEASDRSMEFESTNGGIELTVPPDFQADLDASTVHGSINIDDAFGVQVEKGVVGQRAKAEIGQGGERLRLSTTNGNIKLGKAEPSTKAAAKGKQNGN
jgi:putative adhesin